MTKTTVSSTNELAEAIKNVKEKRHVITKEALQAKREYDQIKAKDSHPDHIHYLDRFWSPMDEFADSIRVLMGLFEQAKLDEAIHLMSNPARLFGVNFLLGLIRGLGFALGLGIVVLVILKFI